MQYKESSSGSGVVAGPADIRNDSANQMFGKEKDKDPV